MSDLIQRLKEHAGAGDGVSPYNADRELISEAISEIERLRAENESLREQLEYHAYR